MADEGARLTGLGKVISILLIVVLVGGGGYVIWSQFGGSDDEGGGGGKSIEIEDADLSKIVTVDKYDWVPGAKLPAVKGVSKYKWDDAAPVLRFSYNVWAGWLPVIAANHGTEPNEDSIFFKKYGFKVELVLMDDPVMARDAFAAGEVHTLWGTLDMHVLFAPGLLLDTRSAPRIVQLVDWSCGGDGIVVRQNIETVADLKGKTIALAQNSPSEYYLNSLLLAAGIEPKEVKTKFTATAFEAATAFVADRDIDGCVSWAPDIYNIPDNVPGTRILSTTADASKLIADVYAVRADFVRDHPDVVRGLMAGIFEGMDMVKKDPKKPAEWMAKAFGMKTDDIMAMRADFHPTNFAENLEFFMNPSNPTNLQYTWRNASYVYHTLRKIDKLVPFDQVMDFTFVQEMQKAGAFAHHVNESKPSFTPAPFHQLPAEKPIIRQTIRINFYPNSANPYEPARDEYDQKIPGTLYDKNVHKTLERVATLAGQFERCIVLIEGHTDSSMKGKGVPLKGVKDLSLARANAIKEALVEKYKFDPDKFSVEGRGWDVPADPDHPLNQFLNRRVEISVFPPEQD